VKQSVVEAVPLVKFLVCRKCICTKMLSAGSGTALMNISQPGYVFIDRILL